MTSVSHPASESGRAAATRVAAALRTEAGLARVALGIATLHVVDDNFLQPQPGTSAADHLVGGLVQAGPSSCSPGPTRAFGRACAARSRSSSGFSRS